MEKENIKLLAVGSNVEGVKTDFTMQVSKDGGEVETITRQAVITGETNSRELVEQGIKEHYGPDITITQESVPVEIAIAQFGKRIKEVQKVEVIQDEYGSEDCNTVIAGIKADISECYSAIEEEKEQIDDTTMEYGIDANADEVVTLGVGALNFEDSDLDESEQQKVEDSVEDSIERIEILEEDIRELEKKKELIEKFGGKKVTFGHLYSEKLASRSSEIVNNIITKVPFGAFAMYYLCYKKSDDFFQQEHSFMQYMIPIDAELGGFDGENFNLEYMDECQQALKNLVYELYQAIPGKEYGSTPGYGFIESEENNMKNAAMLIREKIISSNPDFCDRDSFSNNYYYKYLHDKSNDCDYFWYKRCNVYPSEVRTPDQEDFDRFLSKCDDEELRELIVSIFKDKASCLERNELIRFIYELYKDNLEYA